MIAKVTARKELGAWNGYLHAGAVVTLADTCCGYGTVRSLRAAIAAMAGLDYQAILEAPGTRYTAVLPPFLTAPDATVQTQSDVLDRLTLPVRAVPADDALGGRFSLTPTPEAPRRIVAAGHAVTLCPSQGV